jgi:hypothetical protein
MVGPGCAIDMDLPVGGFFYFENAQARKGLANDRNVETNGIHAPRRSVS